MALFNCNGAIAPGIDLIAAVNSILPFISHIIPTLKRQAEDTITLFFISLVQLDKEIEKLFPS